MKHAKNKLAASSGIHLNLFVCAALIIFWSAASHASTCCSSKDTGPSHEEVINGTTYPVATVVGYKSSKNDKSHSVDANVNESSCIESAPVPEPVALKLHGRPGINAGSTEYKTECLPPWY